MDGINLSYADLLKPYWLLQLLIGGAVFLAIIIVILKGKSDNKKDAHIAPPGHDPMGIAVMSNQIVGLLATIAEQLRSIGHTLSSLMNEQTKTNARLAELQDSHQNEMERLRETVKQAAAPAARRRQGD